MEARISITGNVGTDVEGGTGRTGRPFAAFRLGCSPGYRERESGRWIDEQTIWLRVRCHGDLARNVMMSVHKGQAITVNGRLRVDAWTDSNGQPRERFEIVADEVGHNLLYGTANYARTRVRVADEPHPSRWGVPTEPPSDLPDMPESVGAVDEPATTDVEDASVQQEAAVA